MNNSFRTLTIAVVAILFGTVGTLAQKTGSTTMDILAIADTATTSRINVLQNKIKVLDAKIAQQEKKLNRVYRDVTVDTELQLNQREDSIYLSMLSERCELNLTMKELKAKGIQSIVRQLSQIPQRNNNATTTGRRKK